MNAQSSRLTNGAGLFPAEITNLQKSGTDRQFKAFMKQTAVIRVGAIRRIDGVGMVDICCPLESVYEQELAHATEVLNENGKWVPLTPALKQLCSHLSFQLCMRKRFMTAFNAVFR
jgi:hypothetical protein